MGNRKNSIRSHYPSSPKDSLTRPDRKEVRKMLNCDLLIDGTRLKKETGNAIIMKIMDSLKGLNVTSALEVLEECKKEVYGQAKL